MTGNRAMKARHYFQIICALVGLALLFLDQAALAGLLLVVALGVEILVSMLTGKQSNDGMR